MIHESRPTAGPTAAPTDLAETRPGGRNVRAFVRTLILLLAVASFAAAAPAEAQGCSCEHFGNQYDGLCEATPEQEFYYNDPSFPTYRYQWVPVGYAYFPDPVDPFSGFAHYDCPPGRSCGLKVRIFYRWPPTTPGGEEYLGEFRCVNGTGGG
jgi:hypothetical protein